VLIRNTLSAANDPGCLGSHPTNVRRDIRDLFRCAKNAHKALKSVEGELSKETLARLKAQDELFSAESDVRKARKAIRDAKEMLKLQEHQIQALSVALAGEEAMHPKYPWLDASFMPVRSTSKNKNSRCGEESYEARPVSSNEISRAMSPHTSVILNPEQSSSLAVMTPSLASTFLHGLKQPSVDNKLWGHSHIENEKLAAAIDAVGKLSQQVQHPLNQSAGSGSSACGRLRDRHKRPYTPVLTRRPTCYKKYL